MIYLGNGDEAKGCILFSYFVWFIEAQTDRQIIK